MSAQNSQEQYLAVAIPTGIFPGNTLTIQTPDGKTFEIIVPPNTQPGQTITVVIPNDAAGGVATSNDQAVASKPHSVASQTIGAVAVAGVLATVVVGPLVGVAVAGAALYATTRDDKIGSASRNAGESICTAFDKANAAAQKYGLFDKVKAAGSASMARMTEINHEYKITDRAKEAGNSAVKQLEAAAKKI